jgi:very-short-patch-repair endonuclease
MPQYFNRRHQVEVRRSLRKNSTLGERLLWRHLRDRQIDGLKFRRQFGILEYVVDFYCHELGLAVEVDGITHATPEAKDRDRRRQRAIESLGVRFLRVQDDDVISDLGNVLEVIRETVTRLKGSSSSPRPLLNEEGESLRSSKDR